MLLRMRPVRNDEPTLAGSPMISAAQKLLAYLREHEAIGLTPSKALQRKFVHWAAHEFDWPGWREEKLFLVNKVLNESDFAPLEALHFVLLQLKLIRHHKLTCRLTKAGRDAADKPGDLFNLIAPFWLFAVDHAAWSRIPDRPLGNWDIFIGVLNREAASGVTGLDLRKALYGPALSDQHYDRLLGNLWSQVLRPLCWLGLLVESESDTQWRLEERVYRTSVLWSRVFHIPYPVQQVSVTRH